MHARQKVRTTKNLLMSTAHELSMARLLNLQATKGGKPLRFFSISHFLHLEFKKYGLSSCWRSICAHLEVQIVMIAHAIQKLHLRYPRYPGSGGFHPMFSLSTVTYYSCNIHRKWLCHSVEGMWGYIFVPFDVLCASVYWSYRYTCTLESVIYPMRFCVYI